MQLRKPSRHCVGPLLVQLVLQNYNHIYSSSFDDVCNLEWLTSEAKSNPSSSVLCEGRQIEPRVARHSRFRPTQLAQKGWSRLVFMDVSEATVENGVEKPINIILHPCKGSYRAVSRTALLVRMSFLAMHSHFQNQLFHLNLHGIHLHHFKMTMSLNSIISYTGVLFYIFITLIYPFLALNKVALR